MTQTSTLTMSFHRYFFRGEKQQSFLQDAAMLLTDGMSLHQVLEMMVQSTRGVTQWMAMQSLLGLRAGQDFSDVISVFIPPVVSDVIRAGEMTGQLANAMTMAAGLLARRTTILSTVFTHLAYPILVVLLSMGVLVFVNQVVFSDFSVLVPINTWPVEAQHLVGLANIIESAGWLILIVLMTGFFGLTYFLKRSTGPFRQRVDHWPLFSLYREFTAARFLEVLGLLLSNGIGFQRAIDICLAHAPRYSAYHLTVMRERLSAGFDKVGDVLDTGMLNQTTIMRLRLLSSHQDVYQVMVRIGEQLGAAQQLKLIKVSQFIAYTLLVLSASLAAVLIASLYQVGELLSTSL